MRLTPKIIAIILGSAFFVLYAVSAAPVPSGIADADELTQTSFFLSVPHPPGFPLFTLIGHWGIVSLGQLTNPAHAANLLSAVYSAIAISLFYLIGKKLFNSDFMAVISSCLFGLSYFVWTYAVIYEITSFTLLLAVVTLYFAVDWYHTSSPKSFFITWAVTGLFLAHFHLGFLYFPGLLWLIVTGKKLSFQTIAGGLAVMICAAVVSSAGLFLLHPNTPVSWDFNPTFSGWWNHLMRQDYTGFDVETNTAYQTAFATPNLFNQVSLHSAGNFFTSLIAHYNWVVFIIMLAGGYYLWQTRRSLFWFNLLLFVFSGPLLAAYLKTAAYSFQTNLLTGIAERQFVLGELAAALYILPGIMLLANFVKAKPKALYLITGILLIYQFIHSKAVLVEPSSRIFNYTAQKQKLLLVEPNALIVCSTDIDCYTLWYLSRVERLRSDVAILSHVHTYSTAYLQPRPDFYPFSQKNNPGYLTLLIAHNYHRRPIYFSSGLNFYDQYLGLENGPFFLIPQNGMFRLSATYPSVLTFTPPPTVSKIDSRNLYSKGIIEALANNQAYAGYLSLKYHQPEIASQFLQSSFSLDPHNLQTQELITNQAVIAQSIVVADPQLTPQKLIDLGKQAEKDGQMDTANQAIRFAYLLGGNDPQIINAALDFFRRANNSSVVADLQELLIYNSQAPMPE